MTERPILFSGPMVHALLDGRKTQTRRIVKPQPPEHLHLQPMFGWNDHDQKAVGTPGLWRVAGPDYPDCASDDRRCPYGVAGDTLWVRETWGLNDWKHGGRNPIPKTRPADLFADALTYRATEDDPEILHEMPFRPSIHMPRWASRLTLQIIEVRVERLHDISEADAIAEGLYRSLPDDADRDWFAAYTEEQCDGAPTTGEWEAFCAGVWMVPGVPQGWGLTKADRHRDTWGPTPQFCYRLLWEYINGTGSWAANPWVWVVTFSVAQR